MDKITQETTVSLSELATVLGLTSKRIRQMVEDGTIVIEEKNQYPLADSVQAYIKFLQKSLPSAEDVKLAKATRVAESTIKASRAKVASLEASELTGKMHRAEDVMRVTEDMLFSFRSGLNALPGRLAVDVVDCKTPAEASEVIKREVHKLMRELADYHYDEERYMELVRERMNWEGVTDDE